jgi:hypothetical protein
VLVLKERTGQVLVLGLVWTNQLASRDTEKLKPLLDDLVQLKAEGPTGAMVVLSFYHRLILPLQDRVHPSFEYGGNPTLLGSHSARFPRWR